MTLTPGSSQPSIYDRLSARFDTTFTDVRGGTTITYITGEQVVSRLNDVLGVAGWEFTVIRHEFTPEADEYWVLGEISADIDGKTIRRQQFGSQKVKRSRSTGMPLDIGFDLKGAATDAMKKCATLLGVGLYLSEKTPPSQQPQRARPVAMPNATRPGTTHAAPGQRPPQIQAAPSAPISIRCKKDTSNGFCGEPLEAVVELGWTAVELANKSSNEFKKPYCWKHFSAETQVPRA